MMEDLVLIIVSAIAALASAVIMLGLTLGRRSTSEPVAVEVIRAGTYQDDYDRTPRPWPKSMAVIVYADGRRVVVPIPLSTEKEPKT